MRFLFENTRKYPLLGNILGVLMHTTALDHLLGVDETLKCGIIVYSGFKIEYTHLRFALAAVVPLGSEGDPGCIFFTLNTHQATFISDILSCDCRKWS